MSPDSDPSGLRFKLLEQFTHTDSGVMAVDARQRIVLWNEPAEALLGYPAEEVLGKSCCDILAASDECGKLLCCENCAVIGQARQRHWSSHQVLVARRKSGERIWLHVLTFGVLSPDGELSSLVHVFWDAGDRPTLSAPKSDVRETARLSPSPLPGLTSQERHVLGCLAAGMDTKTIAGLLFISPTTVRNHIQNILRKLGVHSRLEAVAVANHHHWA